jgi:TRAP-type mannitol/chloroaromatic compound transport system permease large subunit
LATSSRLAALADRIDRLIAVGRTVAWLALCVVLVQFAVVVLRYAFGIGSIRLSVAPPAITTRHIYVGIIPFVLIQLLALALLWFAPGLATWLPHKLYGR